MKTKTDEFLEKFSTASTEAEKRELASHYHAYYETLNTQEKAQSKQAFQPMLVALKSKIMEAEQMVQLLMEKQFVSK